MRKIWTIIGTIAPLIVIVILTSLLVHAFDEGQTFMVGVYYTILVATIVMYCIFLVSLILYSSIGDEWYLCLEDKKEENHD